MINNVRAENFLSWKNLNFNVSEGVTLIDGWNRDDQTPEGSGKSAILNAICWGLYGKIPKDAKIDEVIKNGESSCVVQVQIQDYKVIRSRKPNELYIEKDGKTIKGKDARETQVMIQDLVGLSFEAFCQTVYFAQNYDKKFITSNQEERAKILSEIQDLEVFDRARKEVQEIIKQENKNLAEVERGHNISQIELKNKSEMIELINQQKQREIAEKDRVIQQLKDQRATLEQRMHVTKKQLEENASLLQNYDAESVDKNEDQLNKAIEELENNVIEIRAKLNNAEESETKLKSLSEQLSRYKFDKEQLVKKEQELIKFIKDPTDFCSACGTALGEKDTTHARNELDKIHDESGKLGEVIHQIEQEIREFRLLKADDLRLQHSNMSSAVRELKVKLKGIKDYRNKIDYAKQSVKNTDKLLEGLKYDIEAIEQKIVEEELRPISIDEKKIQKLNKEYEQEYNRMTELKSLLDLTRSRVLKYDALKNGFREIKSYVFNSILNELNVKVNKYASQLFEVPVKVNFTNEDMKIGVDINLDGQERGVGLLSGGQFRRICLSTDLALSEIVLARTGNKLNIRILDEYFKDLSENSMSKCLQLLEKLGGATILIEHNSIFKSIVDNVFEVELSDGTSRSSV